MEFCPAHCHYSNPEIPIVGNQTQFRTKNGQKLWYHGISTGPARESHYDDAR